MAVVVRDNKVLLQRRFRTNKGMVFEFPGGAVDSNESGTEAAIRELWEETELNGLEVLGSHVLRNEYGGEIHYVVMAADSSDEPKATDSERQQEFYWLRVSEIPIQHFFRADVEFILNSLELYT